MASAPPSQRSLFVDVYIDEDFSTEQRFAIESALEEWNVGLNGYYVFRVVNDHAHMYSEMSVGAYDLMFIHMMGDNDSPLAMVDDIPGHRVFWYDSKMSHIQDQTVVIEHEIGHILGANHNHVKGSMLYPFYVSQASAGHCIDQYTMKDVVDAHNFMSLENTKYCIIK